MISDKDIQEMRKAVEKGLAGLRLSMHSCDGKTQHSKVLSPDDIQKILVELQSQGVGIVFRSEPHESRITAVHLLEKE